MKEVMPWFYLLIFLGFLLLINTYLTSEGFYNISTTTFSDFLLSLITINPDSTASPSGQCPIDASGNRPRPPQPPMPPQPPPPQPPPPPPPEQDCLDTSTFTSLMGYLKSDINDIIKNEKLECRNNPISTECATTNTDNLQQGQEAINANPVTKCTKKTPIDMNEYIRKDSIPCWGCTL